MKILNKTIWAITPEMMRTMAEIARESRKTPETIAREMGREMKDTNAASIRDGVAVIKVSGPLFRYANLMTRICGATSYELLAQDFNKAVQSPKIKGILLDIDSPGGEVNGCSEVADMIYQARGTKPLLRTLQELVVPELIGLPLPVTRFWRRIQLFWVLSVLFPCLKRMTKIKQ